MKKVNSKRGYSRAIIARKIQNAIG